MGSPSGRSNAKPAIQNIPLRTKMGKEVGRILLEDLHRLDALKVNYAELEARVMANIRGK